MKFILAKCVWGAAYVNTMLTFNLPSLLAPGNLPAAAVDIEHVLYTTAADRAEIERAPVYHALRRIVRCRIVVTAEEPESGGGYLDNIARMNRIHCRILDDCEATSAVWVFDQPDHVWADGALSYLLSRGQSGARCVMFAGIRTVLEDMGPALAAWRSPDAPALAVPPRALVRAALDCCHAHDAVRFWGVPMACVWPHHVNWRVSPDAFIRRTFFAQPFLVAAPQNGARPQRSVDADYIHLAFPEMAGVEFVRDSDDFLVIEVSRRRLVAEYNPHPLNAPLVAAWAARHAAPCHRDSFTHAIRFHAGGTPERRWRRMERFAAAVAGAIDAMGALHGIFTALPPGRPVLRALFGRLLRDPTAHARLRLPERFTLLVPPDSAIPVNDDIASLVRRTQDHILPGDQPLSALLAAGEATALGGRRLAVAVDDDGVVIGGCRVTAADGHAAGVRMHDLATPLPPAPRTLSP